MTERNKVVEYLTRTAKRYSKYSSTARMRESKDINGAIADALKVVADTIKRGEHITLNEQFGTTEDKTVFNPNKQVTETFDSIKQQEHYRCKHPATPGTVKLKWERRGEKGPVAMVDRGDDLVTDAPYPQIFGSVNHGHGNPRVMVFQLNIPIHKEVTVTYETGEQQGK